MEEKYILLKLFNKNLLENAMITQEIYEKMQFQINMKYHQRTRLSN